MTQVDAKYMFLERGSLFAMLTIMWTMLLMTAAVIIFQHGQPDNLSPLQWKIFAYAGLAFIFIATFTSPLVIIGEKVKNWWSSWLKDGLDQ